MPRMREIESILLTAVAAMPLYFTDSVPVASVIVFHAALLAVAIAKIAFGVTVPPRLLQAAAVAYLIFLPFDAIMLSRSLIRASSHLLFFIAVYQAAETKRQHVQRLLVTFMIFITSTATATHMSIVLFIVAFGYLGFRELMHFSHDNSVESIGEDIPEPPVGKAAAAYLVLAVLLGMLFFPVLPRVRNPMVRGFAGSLSQTSTGFSDQIDFSVPRNISQDPQVLARVWMSREATLFFMPLRLKGSTLNTYWRHRWRDGSPIVRKPVIRMRQGFFRIAQPSGFAREAIVQQRAGFDRRLFLPVGTYAVGGLTSITEEPREGSYSTADVNRGQMNFRVLMSRGVSDFEGVETPKVVQYPVTPEIASLARQITGNARTPVEAASRIERYLSQHYTYLSNTTRLRRAMSVEEFLLKTKRGNCEYFAAGMVVLLTSLDIPARIAGGYYGGEYNPLTGYFVIRQRDAHAWTEVYDGTKWLTFDSTPADLRPGVSPQGIVSAWAAAIGESVSFFWDRYILTFGLADQMELFVRAVEFATRSMATAKITGNRIAHRLLSPDFALLLLVAAGALYLAVRITKRRAPLFEQLAVSLREHGVTVGPSMTAEELIGVVAEQKPHLLPAVREIVGVYREERFSRRGVEEESRERARTALRELARSRGRNPSAAGTLQ